MSAATGGRPDDLPRFISAVIVGDPSARENDSRPQQQGQDSDDPRGRASDDRKVPKRRVSSERNLVAQRDDDRSEEERHLQLKDGALERSCRLAGDHDDAGGEKYRQCPPDNGPEALGNARERLIAAAIDRMWTVCTAGTIHPVLWIVWLRGVCSSHAQKSWSDCVRIGFIRVRPKRFP